jgi:hypothetical protein
VRAVAIGRLAPSSARSTSTRASSCDSVYVMCLPRVPLDLLDEPLLVARVALEPAVALKNLLPDFKESSSL